MNKDEQGIIHLKNIKDQERQEKLAYLRNLGSPNSTTPFKEKDETLSPSQVACKCVTNQRQKKKSHLDYRECPGCLGLYSKRTLWKHQKRCSLCSPSKKGAIKSKKFAINSLRAATTTRFLESMWLILNLFFWNFEKENSNQSKLMDIIFNPTLHQTKSMID